MENIVRRLVKSQGSGAASADALFIGEGKPLGEDGDLSGIFKARVRTIDVGVQGVAEFLVSGILGGIVARAVRKFLK